MNRRLVHDVAMSVMTDLVRALGLTTNEEAKRAWAELFPVVEAGLLRYEVARARMTNRLAKREEVDDDADGPF